MSSSYDFIIDNIRFSFSSLTTYETCPYSFRLTYIDKVDRQDNFFGEYGTLIHDCIFQYFSNDMEAFELSQYFLDRYSSIVKTPPPPYPAGMEEKYKTQGLEFFDSFSFEREKYDILLVEDKIDFDFDEHTLFVAKPDLVLYEKETGKTILLDYKSSAPFKTSKSGYESTDNKKLEGYYKQLFIYTYALRNYKFIPIDEITLWFTRPDRKVVIPWSMEKEEEAIDWLKKTVQKIRNDEKFWFNNTNPYFCDNLCSVRDFCIYRKNGD